MIEKLIKWILKDKEKFAAWALKKLIAWTLPEFHLSKNPVRKQKAKEEGTNNG